MLVKEAAENAVEASRFVGAAEVAEKSGKIVIRKFSIFRLEVVF